jgi:hypothetical protein
VTSLLCSQFSHPEQGNNNAFYDDCGKKNSTKVASHGKYLFNTQNINQKKIQSYHF